MRLTESEGYNEWTITFDVSENQTLYDRRGEIKVSIGDVSHTVSVEQLAMWNPPVNLHDGLANCYMVVPGGSVSIPITRAITIGGLPTTDAATVETLWDDNSVISGSPTLSGSGTSRTIELRASSNKGNAVIALKNAAGSIYWSWHIWVSSYTGVATWTNNGYTFMDRNLGATEATFSLASWGLFYQWGRKDPFPGGEKGTAGYAALNKFSGIDGDDMPTSAVSLLEGIRKPATLFFRLDNWDEVSAYTYGLWNTSADEKTCFDPCPVGWRVPCGGDRTSHPWYGLPKSKWTDMTGAHWGDNGLFPATGMIDQNDYENYGGDVFMMWTTDNKKKFNGSHYAMIMSDGYILNSTVDYFCHAFSVRCVLE
jgi:hypothetical protein